MSHLQIGHPASLTVHSRDTRLAETLVPASYQRKARVSREHCTLCIVILQHDHRARGESVVLQQHYLLRHYNVSGVQAFCPAFSSPAIWSSIFWSCIFSVTDPVTRNPENRFQLQGTSVSRSSCLRHDLEREVAKSSSKSSVYFVLTC